MSPCPHHPRPVWAAKKLHHFTPHHSRRLEKLNQKVWSQKWLRKRFRHYPENKDTKKIYVLKGKTFQLPSQIQLAARAVNSLPLPQLLPPREEMGGFLCVEKVLPNSEDLQILTFGDPLQESGPSIKSITVKPTTKSPTAQDLQSDFWFPSLK